MASWPKQVQDDLAKWEANDAGDPERQADARSSAFDWAKVFKISTPLRGKTCRITRAFKNGTQERWHVPCPHCGHMQPLEWKNLQASIDREHPEKAHFTCAANGCVIEHKDKGKIVAAGTWVADNPIAKEPSFHIWRAYAPTRDWESIAREWLAAEGDPQSEQAFYNDVLGLEYEGASEAPPWEDIRNRSNGIDESGRDVANAPVYERGRIPPGALLICVGVDVQGDRVELHFKGYGEHLRRWTIDYDVIPMFIGNEECWAELDKRLARTFPDAFGNHRGIDMLAIDGNAYTKEVFAWAKRHSWNKVIVVRGAKSDLAPPLALTKSERKPDGTTRKTQKRFYNVGVSGLKSSLYEVLRRHDPLARGYCGYPKGLDDEFYRQLTAEKREITPDKRTGFPRAFWRKDHDRNEVLDTENYAEAAAIRCGWYGRSAESWALLRADREKMSEKGQGDMFDPANVAQAVVAHVTKPKAKKSIAELSSMLNG
jgi:phage terminase large subunit GpA-like protein